MASQKQSLTEAIQSGIFIVSNNSNRFYHLAVERKFVGPKSGKTLHTYYVTACNGKVLGGSYGYQFLTETPQNSIEMCSKCQKLMETNND